MSVTSSCLKKGSKKILAIEITKIVHISVSLCRSENPFQPDLTSDLSVCCDDSPKMSKNTNQLSLSHTTDFH